jgi:glutamyl-tRNA synthetase
MNKKVCVRFAPSPTGELHVGGLRTALYNYLFAKKQGGDFILRIEDTDQTRLVEDAVERLIGTLRGMGVDYTEGVFFEDGKLTEKGDFGPYIQSKRLEIYHRYADELVAKKKAYHCFCSAERLTAMREEQVREKRAPRYDKHCLSLSDEEVVRRKESGEPFVIRFNVSPDRGEISFTDLIRGEVKFQAKDIDDQVLLKSDGFPTYHLAVVVDDHLMEITHVLRSEEWLPSTPKHILLYEAFGWEMPSFGHVSFILGKDGKKKLSKRDGGVSVEYFQSEGYLDEAIINFIALLGWNPGKGNTKEIFSLEEMEDLFDLSGLHKAGAVFDLKKLDWLNGEYIKKMSVDELYRRINDGKFLEKDLIRNAPSNMQTEDYLKRVLMIEQDRLAKLSDVGVQNPFFFTQDLSYDVRKLNWKENTGEMTRESLLRAEKILTELSDEEWLKRETLEQVLMKAAGDHAQSLGGIEAGRGRGDFLWPIRFALTGTDKSPSPFDCAWVLGKEESLRRLKKATREIL